jgi:uncharacterized membrane protein required for colicin V production
MNYIDLILLLMLFGFLALGFFQGTIKLLIAIISFYVSIILASLYYSFLAEFFRTRLRTQGEGGQIIAYAIILLLGFLLLTVAGIYTFRYAKMPPSLDFVDRVVGTLFGFLLGGLLVGMTAEILHSFFVVRSPASGVSFPIMRSLQTTTRSSFLIVFFMDNVLPLIFTLVRPVLPAETGPIFRIRK